MAESQRRQFHVDILCILFGIGTWLCVNGLWVELPLLVQHLPEGWALPSYMAVIIQIANLGPISFTLLNSYFPNHVTERRSIYFVMVVGLVALLLLSQFWMKVANVFGQPHSLSLFVLVLVLASVDCSSRVLYLPFMATLKPEYLTSYFIGEGLSGFIPSVFALIQGAGGTPTCINFTIEADNITISVPATPEPLFSIEAFFYLMAFITILSAVAFHLLNSPSIVGDSLMIPRVQTLKDFRDSKLLPAADNCKFYNTTVLGLEQSEEFALCNTSTLLETESSVSLPNLKVQNGYENTQVIRQLDALSFSSAEFAYLMILLTIICGLANGIFPSIQSYSCLPYGNNTYHWVVTLSNMANPAVCFMMLLMKTQNKMFTSVMACPAFIVSGYVLYSALMSPNPPLVDSIWGRFLLIISWVVLVGLFTFVKVSIATIMRRNGKRGLFWTGTYTQLGSSVGSVTAFLLINFGNYFHSFNPCA